MNRRDILKGGVASLGLAAEASAATAERAAPKFDPAQMEETIARIDRRMAAFRDLDLAPRPPADDAEAELFESRARVTRAAMRTLYFTGAFMELEEHQRIHPGIQTRMQRLQPEMDEATDGMAGLLEALTPADHLKLQQRFTEDPEVAVRIGALLQDVAKEDGFGFSRRVDLRLAVDDFSRRMKAQNPALVIDPYVRKTRKVQANPGTHAERERAFAVRAGEKAFWEFQQRSQFAIATWDRIYSGRPRIDLVGLEDTYPESGLDPQAPDPTRRATKVLHIGGYLMGAGLGSAALGGIFYLISTASVSLDGFIAPAVVLGVTIGPGLLVAGLVVVIIGGIMYAVAKP